jgi:hypothetical protein
VSAEPAVVESLVTDLRNDSLGIAESGASAAVVTWVKLFNHYLGAAIGRDRIIAARREFEKYPIKIALNTLELSDE